jgi:hypothetical protein
MTWCLKGKPLAKRANASWKERRRLALVDPSDGVLLMPGIVRCACAAKKMIVFITGANTVRDPEVFCGFLWRQQKFSARWTVMPMTMAI